MSIQGLVGTPSYTENRRAAARQTAPSCASFQSRLEKTAAGAAGKPETHHLCMGEDVACSGGIAGRNGGFQEFCAHYTEDSTPEDPIVRISGVANSGPFDFICHINEVDPANASYAELAALRGHLAKTGQCVTGTGTLPCTMDFREDITRKYDFISGIQNSLGQSSHIFPTASSIAGANELLALYQNYTSGAAGATPAPCWSEAGGGGTLARGSLLDTLNEARLLLLQRTREGQEWKKEQEEWDRLMKGLDSWIEALRERSERERKEGGGVTAEGGEALMALYRGYIAAAVQAESSGAEPELAREDLLSALTAAQGELLARLKEDKAAEEEREEWADLLRRLDTWIEALRGEPEEPERVARVEGSALKDGTGQYKM